jgi:hypothetical protein
MDVLRLDAAGERAVIGQQRDPATRVDAAAEVVRPAADRLHQLGVAADGHPDRRADPELLDELLERVLVVDSS